MPYKSEAQRKYFNANREKLESQGVDVDEWNESSRGNKLPEKVKEKEASDALSMLHRQASQLLAKFAAEEYARRPNDESENNKPVKKSPPSAKGLVNMDSIGGALADYLVPESWGGERAGRTQAMANAIGEKTTFGVRHPLLQSWGYGLVGGVPGALLGGGAGLLAGGLTGGPRHAEKLAPIGALLGGGAGLLGGLLLAGRHRRDEMKRIGHFYDQDAAEEKLKPKNPKFSILSALLLPGRGPHRVGQLEATRAIRGDKSMADQRGVERDVLYSSRFLPYVGGPMGLLHGYGQNIRTQLASGGDDNAVADSFERRPKTASDDVDEWNKDSKGKKLPEKTNDSEKKAFVRQLIGYLLKKRNNEVKSNHVKPGVEPMNDQQAEIKNLSEKAASLLRLSKHAGITDNIPEILGALGGGIAGGLKTPEVTNANNPIINRIRGDVYPVENARMQNILRGALTGLTGVVGGRAGHAAGTLLAKTPLVANRFVSPGLQELIKQVVPKITMLGGAGVGGAGGLAGYDLLKNLAERSKDLGKSEKKSYADPRLYPGAQGIYTPKDMNLNNSSTGRAVNQAIPAANQSTLLDKFLDANRASNRQAISFGNTVAGGIGGGLLGRLAGGLLAKRLGGNLSPELIKRIGLGVGTGAGGAAGYVSGQRQINSNPYLKDPTYLSEKKSFADPRLYPGARGIYTPKDMNLNNSSTGRAVNQAIPAANQSTLLDKFLDANRAASRRVISAGNTMMGGMGGGLLGHFAGNLLAKRLGGNLSPELIKKIGLGIGTGAGGAAGYVQGQRQINSNPYLKDPTYLKQGYVLSPAEKRAFIEMVKVARCWKGYEPVPGKKAYSDGSCRPVGSGDKKKTEKKAFNTAIFNMARQGLNQGAGMLGRGLGNMASGGMRMAGQLGSAGMRAAAPVAQAGFNMARQGLNRIPGSALAGAGVGAAGMAAMPYALRGLNQAGEALGQGAFDTYQTGKNMVGQGMNMAYNAGMAPFRGLHRAGEALGQGAFDAYQGGKNMVGQGMNMAYNAGMAPVRGLHRAGEALGQGAFDTYQGGKNMLGQGLQNSGQMLSSAGRYLQNP